jgi:hypothetical protein
MRQIQSIFRGLQYTHSPAGLCHHTTRPKKPNKNLKKKMCQDLKLIQDFNINTWIYQTNSKHLQRSPVHSFTCWSVSSHHETQEAHQEPEKENVSRSKADTRFEYKYLNLSDKFKACSEVSSTLIHLLVCVISP